MASSGFWAHLGYPVQAYYGISKPDQVILLRTADMILMPHLIILMSSVSCRKCKVIIKIQE